MLGVGSTIKRGRWRIDEQLAAGGVATVFAATHTNGKRAALKVLSEAFVDDVEMRERFLREGYAANTVGHPGVVSILDDDFDDGIAYLVMELLEGEALDRRFERLGRKLPFAEVLRIGEALLDVLAAAHAKEIVHRDIKPANLFMLNDGSIKVLDFGFAKVKQTATEIQTTVGAVLGTPGFVAPERLIDGGREIDARTDIWSVGATLFLLSSGSPVVESENVAMTLHATATEPARSLATVAPTLPRGFIAVVDRALAFSPDDRWPSAEAMRDALRDLALDDEPTRIGNVEPPPPVDDAPIDEPTTIYADAHGKTVPAPSMAGGAPASEVVRVVDDDPHESRGHTVVMTAPSSTRSPILASAPASQRHPPSARGWEAPPAPAAHDSAPATPAWKPIAVALAIGVVLGLAALLVLR